MNISIPAWALTPKILASIELQASLVISAMASETEAEKAEDNALFASIAELRAVWAANAADAIGRTREETYP